MMSLEILVKVLAIEAQRFILRAFRYSNARPIVNVLLLSPEFTHQHDSRLGEVLGLYSADSLMQWTCLISGANSRIVVATPLRMVKLLISQVRQAPNNSTFTVSPEISTKAMSP